MPEIKQAVTETDDVQDFAYLGREFMTWLLWRVDAGEGDFGARGEEFSVAFGGRVRLGAPLGFATDLVLKGSSPAYGAEARAAIGSGHTLREAEMRVTRGELEWRFTLIGETLDLRSVKLPALLKEAPGARGGNAKGGKSAGKRGKGKGDDDASDPGEGFDERFTERLTLLEELDQMVRTAFATFMRERLRPAWKREVVPALRTWLVDGLAVSE